MEEGKKKKGTRHRGLDYDVVVAARAPGDNETPTRKTVKKTNSTSKNKEKKNKKNRGPSSKKIERHLGHALDFSAENSGLGDLGEKLTADTEGHLINRVKSTTKFSQEESGSSRLVPVLDLGMDGHQVNEFSLSQSHPKTKQETNRKTEQKKHKGHKNKTKKPANPSKTSKEGGNFETMCPICYQTLQKEDRATVPGCGHHYCVYCILRWTEEKINHTCPQCKRPFDSLKVFRNLDGTIRDASIKENVGLLRRTDWYNRARAEHVKSSALEADVDDFDDWDDEYFSNEIDDAEDYYFSNAAGSARIVIANRTFGKNGFIRSGRVYAHRTQSKSDAQPKDGKILSGQRPDREKTEPKGKKARKRAQKKMEAAHRLL